MKKLFVKTLSVLVVSFLFTGTIFAQDVKKESKKESKISIKIVKDGETVLDSTFVPSEGMDHEKIQKLLEKFSGDNVEVDWFDASDNKEFKMLKGMGDSKSMEMKVFSDEAFEFVFDGEAMADSSVFVWKSDSSNGNAFFHVDEKMDHPHGKTSKDHNVMIYNNEDGEESGFVEIIVDGDHKNMSKEGNVFFHGDSDKVNSNYKVLKKGGNVIMMHDGESAGEGDFEVIMKGGTNDNISWTSDDNVFFGDVSKKKAQIKLKSLGYDEYRLEYNSENLESVLIEVFNSEGKRQFKKKVKNFYGRFIKEIELEGNEIPFFSVKVVQGDKEIIGEFEFK